MVQKNIIEDLINKNQGYSDNSLIKLGVYLSSNKDYKYTSTYVNDSENGFNLFVTNVDQLSSKLNLIYKDLFNMLLKIPLGFLDYKIEIQINNSVTINSDEGSTIMLVKKNEPSLLALLNKKDFINYYLTLIFHYDLEQCCVNKSQKRYKIYPHIIKHTYYHNKNSNIQDFYNEFTNLIKLSL